MGGGAWSKSKSLSLVRLIGFLCILSSPLWVYGLFFPFPSDYWIKNDAAAFFLVLVLLVAIQAFLIRAVAARDHFTAEVMMVGFLLKLAAVSAYMFTSVRIYEGVGDVFFYFFSGSAIADKLSLTGEWTFLRPFWSTNFIIMLTSWLVVVFGPCFQALMIIFAAVSYWGQYLFYRSFCIAFPKQQHQVAGLFMFFLPSLVYWTATIGKDAVIFFFIGGCCYGFAKMVHTNRAGGLVLLLTSLGGVMLIRPHVAGMLAIPLCIAYLYSKNRRGTMGMAVKICVIPLLLFANAYLIVQMRNFVIKDSRQLPNVLEETQSVLQRAGEVNLQVPGSTFGNSLSYRLIAAPFLLFRPFPWEVRNPQMAVAAVESLALMAFVWRRRKLTRPSFKKCRENAFLLFAWLYFWEFSFLLAGAMTNFGLLARQRDMLIPLAMMIFLSQPLPSSGRVTMRYAKGLAWATH